jgi:peptide/nickel transport system permease protein
MDDPFIQVIKKILGFIFSLVLIATIVFVIFRVLPSDPVSLMFRHYPGNDVAEFWRHNLGLDKSLPEQYATWLVGAFTGQFGISAGFAPREPIAAILPPYLGKTLILFSVITGISLFLGAILGRFVAKREDRPVDSILSRFAAVFFSAPAFLVTLIIVTTMAALSPGWPFQGSTSDSFYWLQLDPIG